MEISIGDRKWLHENYPGLEFKFENGGEIVCGRFEFSAAFDSDNGLYIINPSDINKNKFRYIEDFYNIKIVLPFNSSIFPCVKEIGGKIKNVANILGKPLIDLHIYENGTCCLIGPYHELENITFKEFMNGPVLQFFFDQSYYENFQEWPRGVYSHGYLGLIENYFDNVNNRITDLEQRCIQKLKNYNTDWPKVKKLITSEKKIKGHMSCICNSNIKFRNCHPEVLKGIILLQKYCKENLIELN